MSLILRDMCVDCAVPVIDWHEHGMRFEPGKGARQRTREPDLFVAHWTGAENPATTLYNTLINHKVKDKDTGKMRPAPLGVEFYIDPDANVYQFADPAHVDTFDAGDYNARSIGCEIASFGHRVPKGKKRNTASQEINSKRYDVAVFTPEQMRAFVFLLAAVLRWFPKIPMRVPRDATGTIIKRTLTKEELATYSGVVGHFHLTERKVDPGLEPFEVLSECGYI